MLYEPLKSRLIDLAGKPAGSFLHIGANMCGDDFSWRTTWYCNKIRLFLSRHNTRKHIKFSVKFKNDIVVWVIDRRHKARPVPSPKPNPRKFKTIKQYRDVFRISDPV